jgi:hypothetical protein
MCILLFDTAPATLASPRCPAQALDPSQRQRLAVQALAGTQPIAQLAEAHQVSRKFVYQQADKADQALRLVFDPADDDERVLFYLPVTKAWLRQLLLALVLICHSSLRGVVELFRDLFDLSISLGTVFNIVRSAVPTASQHNGGQELSGVRLAALDEIFQAGTPVLVGCDVSTSYCFLLSQEECRDGDTWGVRLLELQERQFAPQATIADGGQGLRAGQKEALPTVPCRGDVFHALRVLTPLVGYLDNRAYEAMAACSKLQRQLARPGKLRDRTRRKWIIRLSYAQIVQQRAIALADDVALLLCWVREDILAVSGPDYASRCALYDFVVAELHARETLCPHRLEPARKYLENQRHDLLAFAAQLDLDLATLAAEHQVPVALARETLHVQALSVHDVRRGPREAALWRTLGGRYQPLREAIAALRQSVVRASSVVENLNSRLRNYFTLRRHLGVDYLKLLQFFLNHRRFLRSEHPARVDKSPTELLTGRPHAHWLELLGYTRFRRRPCDTATRQDNRQPAGKRDR